MTMLQSSNLWSFGTSFSNSMAVAPLYIYIHFHPNLCASTILPIGHQASKTSYGYLKGFPPCIYFLAPDPYLPIWLVCRLNSCVVCFAISSSDFSEIRWIYPPLVLLSQISLVHCLSLSVWFRFFKILLIKSLALCLSLCSGSSLMPLALEWVWLRCICLKLSLLLFSFLSVLLRSSLLFWDGPLPESRVSLSWSSVSVTSICDPSLSTIFAQLFLLIS